MKERFLSTSSFGHGIPVNPIKLVGTTLRPITVVVDYCTDTLDKIHKWMRGVGYERGLRLPRVVKNLVPGKFFTYRWFLGEQSCRVQGYRRCKT